MDRALRVCIDARVAHGTVGGIQQFIHGLVSGLASLTDGDEEYVILGDEDAPRWLPAVPKARWGLQVTSSTARAPTRTLTRALSRAAPRVAGSLGDIPGLWRVALPPVPASDGTVEALGADLVHFTAQTAFLTSVPSIYHPHDLQHVHLPALFSRRERFLRERNYRTFCARARMVAVASSWTRDDVSSHYGLSPDKVSVVPLAPATETYSRPSGETARAFLNGRGLPREFLFYPAQTWPHKNHLRLLEALALLRTRGLSIPLVCSGHLTSYYPTIRRRSRELGLEADTHFLGFVTPAELQALYACCRAVVIPSLFEAGSFPLWEAFLSGAPAACSNVTSLPAQAGDSAVVFDPRDPAAIAYAVQRVWRDEPLRATLIQDGTRNVSRFRWRRTALLFRAHYRRLTGRPLTTEDANVLSEKPLL